MIIGQLFNQSNIYAVTTQILLVLSHGSKYLPKIRLSNGYVFKYEHLKRFIWKYENISAYKRKIKAEDYS